MFCNRQQTLVLLVAMALAHLPVPWWHKHESLDSVALAEHSTSYHRGQGMSELPHGWHWHLLQADAALSPLANNEPMNRAFEHWIEATRGPVVEFSLHIGWLTKFEWLLSKRSQVFQLLANARALNPPLCLFKKLCVWRL